MDKYEYRVRAEEINALIEKREYAEAVKIADTIDWRRVKSVTMLCKVSELYKMNRRYEDSRDILLLAYERQPGSRKIVYSLCELSIKLEELVLAIEYYKEFVQVAPRDTGRFILQYRLYEAQEVSLEERIAVLEEYKKRDYREKWAYELAYLYHRVGLATRCVEECDELILWFGEGKYVIKAMELKMLHVPLSPTQQEKYDKRFQTSANAYVVKTTQEEEQKEQQETEEDSAKEGQPSVTTDTIPSMPIQIKAIDPSNLPTTRIPSKDISEQEVSEAEEEVSYGQALTPADVTIDVPDIPVAQVPDDLDIHVKTIDMGQYNTINLQKELAENLAKVMEQEDKEAMDATKPLPVDDIKSYADSIENEAEAPVTELPSEEELLRSLSIEEELQEVTSETTVPEEAVQTPLEAETPQKEIPVAEDIEEEPVDEQITGQLSFDDIMAEWEETKKATEEKHLEEMRRKVMAQTGPMFKNFDEEAKAGLQADLDLIAPSLDVFEGQASEEESIPDIPSEEELLNSLFPKEEELLAGLSAEEEEVVQEVEEVEETPAEENIPFQSLASYVGFEPVESSEPVEKPWQPPKLVVEELQESAEEPVIEESVEEEPVEEIPVAEMPVTELPSEEELLNSLFPKEEEPIEEPVEETPVIELPSEEELLNSLFPKAEEPIEEESVEEPVAESEVHSPILNTAEIYGLEEKLISDAMSQAEKEPEPEPELEIPQIHDLLEEEPAEEPELESVFSAAPIEESAPEPVFQAAPIEEPEPEPVFQAAPVEEPAPEPVFSAAPVEEPAPEPVFQAAPVEEPAPEPVFSAAPVEEPAPEPQPQPEQPGMAFSKPTGNTEEFDKNLESMVLAALEETEKREEVPEPKPEPAPEPAVNPLTQTTGFIIADLSNVEETPQPKEQPIPVKEEKVIPVRRTLTRDEKELFGSIAQTKEIQEEVANAIDNISLNPCIGNVIVTGEKGTGTLTVAKNLVKVLSINDDNFSGKVAKISGELLNNKSIGDTINNLSDGALIIEQAGALDDMALLSLGETLKKKADAGILVVLEDTKKEIERLMAKGNMPKQLFDLRVDIAALDNDGLVNYGKEYANEKEYSIDAMGVLALYTRIAEMQTNEHAVTVDEVREIVDEAIQNAGKKNVSHFVDILLAKRYDDDDMIVLREKDFLK